MGVMVLLPVADFTRPAGSTGLVTFACRTDNSGSSFLFGKLLPTKYPLDLMLVELSYQLSLRRAALKAHWIPSLQSKEEADALTNFQFDQFNPGRRIPVNLGELKLKFGVLNELLDQGEVYVKELEDLKAETRCAGARNACWCQAKEEGRGHAQGQEPMVGIGRAGSIACHAFGPLSQ